MVWTSTKTTLATAACCDANGIRTAGTDYGRLTSQSRCLVNGKERDQRRLQISPKSSEEVDAATSFAKSLVIFSLFDTAGRRCGGRVDRPTHLSAHPSKTEACGTQNQRHTFGRCVSRAGGVPNLKGRGQRVPAQVDSPDGSAGWAAWDRQKFLACGNRRTNPRRARSC